MAASGASVLTSAIINIVTVLICFFVFAFLRKWQKAKAFYDSKRVTPAVKVKPHAIPDSLFGWMKAVVCYSEPDVIRQSGLDTAVYIRLLDFGFELFLYLSVWCLAAVLPTNITDREVDHLMSLNSVNGTDSAAGNTTDTNSTSTPVEYKFSEFDKLSLSNVEKGSHRMWVHIATVYFVTIITCWLLYRYTRHAVLLRVMFIANGGGGGATTTVLVTDVPAVAELTAAGLKERNAADKAEAKAKAEVDKAAKQAKKEAKKGGKASKGGKDSKGKEEEGTSKSSSEDVEEGPHAVAEGVESEEVVLREKPPAAVEGTLSKLRKRAGLKTEAYDVNERTLSPLECARDALADGMSPQDLVENEFGCVYGDDVAGARVVADTGEVDPLVAEYDKLRQALDDYVDEVRYKAANGLPTDRKTTFVLLPSLGPWGKAKYGGGLLKKVDALEFWTSRLAWLEAEITQKAAPRARKVAWPSAFVTFKRMMTAAAAATALHHHDETSWVVRPAPPPAELIWGNLGMTKPMRTSRAIGMTVLFWLMALFFMIPVGAIQGLIDVPKLASIPGLGAFVSNVVVKKLLEAIVPGLVLKIFLALVPTILAAMAKAGGAVSTGEVDLSVVSRFFIFQVIVVFFGSVVAGSFFSQAKQWIEDPGSVISILGTSIPQTSTFFITFLWVLTGTASIGFLRVVGLVLLWLFTWLAGGPKVRERLVTEQYTSCGTSVVGHTMVILLGIVYCCINPIITPSALAYFGVVSLVERYNNIYVYRRTYESAGLLWRRVLNQVMTGLYIFQLCMIGLISIKKFPYSPVMIPAILGSIAFHISTLNLFARPATLTALHDAAELDAAASEMARADPEAQAAKEATDLDAYVAPAFKVRAGDITPLLADATEVGLLVDADVKKRAEEKAAKKAAKGKK